MVNGDVHIAAWFVQVFDAKGRILHINFRTRQCRENGKTLEYSEVITLDAKYRLFVDLPRGGEDKIHEELQGYESEQDYDYCRLEHW